MSVEYTQVYRCWTELQRIYYIWYPHTSLPTSFQIFSFRFVGQFGLCFHMLPHGTSARA